MALRSYTSDVNVKNMWEVLKEKVGQQPGLPSSKGQKRSSDASENSRGGLGLNLTNFSMQASKWPSGFYDEDAYDPKDKTAGLFRNPTTARVCLIYFAIKLILNPLVVL